MLKRCITLYSTALLLSLSSFCYAQKVVEKPTQAVPSQADIFKQAKKIADQDLSKLKHPIKPMLWKVEGNDLKKASCLFGSIHVADTNITTLHPAAAKAYQQADTLATEVALDLKSQLAASKMMTRKDKKTLKQSIGDELYTELNTQLADINPALAAEPFNQMKTWAVMLIHGMIEEQMQAGARKPLDLQLWDRAGKDNKIQWSLETLDEQMGGLDKLTDDEQKTLLKDTLFAANLLKKEKLNAMTMLKNLYLKGDPHAITTLLLHLENIDGTNAVIGQKFKQLLLFDRNDRIAAKIHKTFKKNPHQSHFIVAGTMHYIGEHNIIEILRKQGYTVTRKEK